MGLRKQLSSYNVDHEALNHHRCFPVVTEKLYVLTE
jgi:hypothetical protein